MALRICPTCERITIVDGARFCSFDGKALVPKPACRACGLPIYPSDRFCAFCGAAAAEPSFTPFAPPALPTSGSDGVKVLPS